MSSKRQGFQLVKAANARLIAKLTPDEIEAAQHTTYADDECSEYEEDLHDAQKMYASDEEDPWKDGDNNENDDSTEISFALGHVDLEVHSEGEDEEVTQNGDELEHEEQDTAGNEEDDEEDQEEGDQPVEEDGEDQS